MDASWYISVTAIRAYMRIAGYRDETDGEWFDRAERELFDLASLARPVGAPRDGRWLTYRAKADIRGRRTRLDLIVSTEERAEGDLPQLVMVRSQGGNRQGAGARERRDERDGRQPITPTRSTPSTTDRDLIRRLVALADRLLDHRGITDGDRQALTEARKYLNE